MRDHSSIVQEMDRQGRYLHSILKTDKLNKLAWLEFRHVVKVMDRLRVNLTDFNAVHFGPSNLRHRKSSPVAARARPGRRKMKN